MPEKYMAETGPTENQELKSRTGGSGEDRPKTPESEEDKKKEEEQKKSEREKARRELVIELKVDSGLAKEVKELVKSKVYEAKAKDGTVLSQGMLDSGDFAVGLRDFDKFIIVNTKTGQAFEISTAKRREDTRQAVPDPKKKSIDGVEYQIEYDAAGQEMSRTVLNQEPVKLTDAKGIDWLVDPKTGMKRPVHPMAGGAPDDADTPYVPGMSQEEMQKLVQQQVAEALARQAAGQAVNQAMQKGFDALALENFQANWARTRQMFPSTPTWNPSWNSIRDADPEHIYNFQVANNIPIIPTQDQLDQRFRLPPDSGHQSTVERNALSFDEIYKHMVDAGVLAKVGDPKSVKDLNEADREKFFANLDTIEGGRANMNQILLGVLESSEFVYPGQELAAVLRIDKKMGLGGDLVRRAVEQRMALEEYDDTKQMRQESVGALHSAIGQYLGSEPALQQELKVLVYVRLKLHETTILGRYVGVDKMSEQMSSFYQDEFRIIEDTRLFKESSMMMESEYGAYFRKGKGFKDREEEYRHQRSERYEPTTIKMALLLVPSLPDEAWEEKISGEPNPRFCGVDRKLAVEAARRFVEKTNLYRRDGKKEPNSNLDKIATWDEVLSELVREGKLTSGKQEKLKDLLENKSTVSRLIGTGKMNFGQAYRVVRAGFDLKSKMDESSQKVTPMDKVVDALNVDSSDSPSATTIMNIAGHRLSDIDRRNLIDVYNEANRAFGLSTKVFDIYGISTRYDCLIDKKGEVMKPKTAILKFPDTLTWVHIFKEEEADYSRPFIIAMIPDLKDQLLARFPDLKQRLSKLSHTQSHDAMEKAFGELSSLEKKEVTDFVDYYVRDDAGRANVEKELAKIVQKYKGKKIDLAQLDGADDSDFKLDREDEQMLKVVRGLSAKTIRDTRTQAMREMIFSRWNEIDIDASTRGRGIREFRKAMWNQIYKAGANTDTPGKKELLRYESTDIVSLMESNARKSMLDQMKHWDDDFANMKKWCEELRAGSNLRKSFAEGEIAMFNSTSRLNDPVEHLKKYKDMIGDWTQEHRNNYMDHLSEAPIEYITKYNKTNAGYKNADVVRSMNLMNDMFWNSVLTPKKKKEMEARYYGGHYLAHIQYGAKKGHWLQGVAGFIGDIFKESVKTLTK